MMAAAQYVFWSVGILSGVVTIIVATARVVRSLDKIETQVAVMQHEVHALCVRMDRMENKHAAST